MKFYFDYVDPLSFAVDVLLRRRATAAGEAPPATTEGSASANTPAAGGVPRIVERIPFERVPPPCELTDPDDPAWRRALGVAEEVAGSLGISLSHPWIVPWTRKAHELALHAAQLGVGEEIHSGLFDAFFIEGLDIGRIDVLQELASRHGLDPTETKATLDTDRYTERIEALRRGARATGVTRVPTLIRKGARLEGFHNAHDLRTFLQ